MTPIPDPRRAAAIVLLASAAILLTAFAFQYLGGLAPCVLCIWQRWPYGLTIALAALALALPPGRATSGLLAVCGLAFLVGAGIAAFHVGVEQHWWQGTASCGSTFAPATSIDALRAQLLAQPVVRCDEVAWSLFGLSMAGYNFLMSVALAGFAFAAAGREEIVIRGAGSAR